MSEPAQAQPSSLPQFVTYNQLAASLQLSRQSIGEMIRDGRLPAPVPLGANAVRFNADEVRAALEKLRLKPPKIALRARGKHAHKSLRPSADDLL